MSKKFGRVVEVIVSGREFNNELIDIDFMYDFDDELENNVSEINLWNVSDDTINRIEKGAEVILKAGYGDDVGVILIGKVGEVEVNHYSVDRELKLYVSDGVNLWGTRVKKTYENLPAKDIVEDVLSEVGLSIGKIMVENNRSYGKLVLDNSLVNILNDLAHNTDSKFYIKNGKGYFVNKEYSDKNVVVLNKDSGLLNNPTRQTIDERMGWSVTCLLEHRISVGSTVSIQSKTANGVFRVVKGKHNSDFTTQMEVLPL